MEQYMNWYASVLRPNAKRVINIAVGPKAFGNEQFSAEVVDSAKQEFFHVVLKQLN